MFAKGSRSSTLSGNATPGAADLLNAGHTLVIRLHPITARGRRGARTMAR
jgi:hypothetical protein